MAWRQVLFLIIVRDILISQCPLYASGKLNDIRETIAVLDPEKSLLVAQSFSTDKTVPAVKLQTTVGRELMYAYDHAVHHMAITQPSESGCIF